MLPSDSKRVKARPIEKRERKRKRRGVDYKNVEKKLQ